MWHAQNKLSLTVFGAYAVRPGKAGYKVEIYILIISEILDPRRSDCLHAFEQNDRPSQVSPESGLVQGPNACTLPATADHTSAPMRNAAHFLWTLVFRLALKLVTLMRFSLLSPFTPTLLQLSAAALPQVKELQLPVSVLYLAEQHGKRAMRSPVWDGFSCMD